MKFKKVKIQAFRAYKEVENGTFDFSVTNGENVRTADFISLYAPNGFGKTSFYDAVEYGFTNSIDRFLKNVKHNRDVAKSERSILNNKNGQYILRNRLAPDDLKSEIRLYTTLSENEIKKEIPANKRKDSTDFHFDESKVKNKFFQTVILSQEWIDAFLKVDDPGERYEKFMNFFGDSTSASYYKNLVDLININEKKINQIKKDLTGIQKELNFDGDQEILKKVNEKISELVRLGEKLNLIEDSFSTVDSINISNEITERISDLSFEKIKQEELIKYINVFFAGSDEIAGVEAFFNSEKRLNEVKASKEKLKKALGDFDEKQARLTEIASITTRQQGLSAEREKLTKIQQVLPTYLKIEESVKWIFRTMLTPPSGINLQLSK